MKSILHIVLFVSVTLLLPIAYAFPSWDNINTIYYNSSQDDVTNKFLQQAANELKTNLENVSLKTFTIVNTTKPSIGIFLINDSSHPQLTGKNDEAFWLYTNDTGIYVIGKTPIAVRHGAYTLLEKLGFRWFFKSEAWNVKPDSLVSLDGLNEVKEPFLIFRSIFQGGERGVDRAKWQAWQRRNSLWGAKQYNAGETYQYIISRTDTTAPPEVFCPGGSPTWPNNQQLRPDHPYVLEKSIEFARRSLNLTAVSNPVIYPDALPPGSAYVSPNDGGGWCTEYNDDKQVITDKVFGLANEVAKAVAADFPGKYIGIYSYYTYDILPTIPLQPNLLVMVTTSPEINYPVQSRLEGFAAKGVMTGVRDYYDVSVWDQDRPPMSERYNEFHDLLRSIPLYADRGAKQFIAEAGDGWGAKGLLYYAASKLFGDPYLDLNAILDDFYTKAFGPAKAPMKRYYEWLNSDPVLTERSIAYALNQLNEAETLAKDNPPVLERIRHAQYYVQYLWRRNIYKSGDNLQDTKDLYKFIHRIRDTYVLYHYYREAELATTLKNAGVSDAEITSLQNTTLPTPEEARGWMDTMLASFAGKDLTYAPLIDVSNLTLVPLGEDGVVKLPAVEVRNRNAMVYATAGSTVTMTGSYRTLYWKDPAGNELDIRTGSPPGTLVSGTFEFKAPTTGVYRLYLWGSISNISAPAAYLVGTPEGGVGRWFEGTPQAYFYVPNNIPVLVFGVRRVYSNAPTPTVNVYALVGNQTIGGQCDSTCEWSIANPAPGLWKLDATIGWGTTLWLLGVPPLLWNDPQYLLVPANAVLKLILGQYRQAMKPIVDGSNITIEIPIIIYDKSLTTFTLTKPLWNRTINFRFNESASITTINDTHISFTVDPNKSVSLLFDIPPPRKTKDIVAIQNQTFYRKEITITSNNSLSNVTATIDINNSYSNYKLYELQGSTWIDVTSQYALTISDNKAVFSGFSTSDKQFRLEGSILPPSCIDNDNDSYYAISAGCSLGNDCNDANVGINPGATDICGNSIDEDCSGADLSCPEQSTGGTSSGGSSGGGGGAIVSISAPIEKPITKEPETTSPQQVIESTGAVSLELSAPDTVESGDYYDATVKLLSPIKKTYTLKIADVQQQIALDAGKEKTITVPIYAPDAKGAFTLTASIDGTTRTKDISLNFLPLILTVDKSKSGNQTLVNITVKNYQPLSTELRIIKDGRSDVFIELIEGQKEYQRQLKLTQPGEYKIIATASSEGKVIDTDQYLLSVEGKKSSNYGLILIVVFSFAVIVIMITFLVRQPKID